jgi:exopolysaccharide biosynthesis WecB/TagA/CpsF family protein
MEKIDILGIQVGVGRYTALLDKVIREAKRGRAITIAPVAIHPLVLANFNREYKKTLNQLDHVLPDSFWHLWGINFLYKTNWKERFYGPDLMTALCERIIKESLQAFLYGGKNQKTLDKLEKWFYGLKGEKGKVHKFLASFSIDDKEIAKLAKEINKLGKGVLFVGVGSPLQHKILVKLKKKVNMPIVGVGAAFDILSGEEKRAPEFLRKHGLEWLFRLLQNPVRLFGRHLYSLLYFPYLARQKTKKIYSSLLTSRR